jgi:hypothetical protein
MGDDIAYDPLKDIIIIGAQGGKRASNICHKRAIQALFSYSVIW